MVDGPPCTGPSSVITLKIKEPNIRCRKRWRKSVLIALHGCVAELVCCREGFLVFRTGMLCQRQTEPALRSLPAEVVMDGTLTNSRKGRGASSAKMWKTDNTFRVQNRPVWLRRSFVLRM